MAEYFSVYKGSDQGKKVQLNSSLHPSLQRAYNDVLINYWLEVCVRSPPSACTLLPLTARSSPARRLQRGGRSSSAGLVEP